MAASSPSRKRLLIFSLFLLKPGGASVYNSDGGALGELPPAVECATNPNNINTDRWIHALSVRRSQSRFREAARDVLWVDKSRKTNNNAHNKD